MNIKKITLKSEPSKTYILWPTVLKGEEINNWWQSENRIFNVHYSLQGAIIEGIKPLGEVINYAKDGLEGFY